MIGMEVIDSIETLFLNTVPVLQCIVIIMGHKDITTGIDRRQPNLRRAKDYEFLATSKCAVRD